MRLFQQLILAGRVWRCIRKNTYYKWNLTKSFKDFFIIKRPLKSQGHLLNNRHHDHDYNCTLFPDWSSCYTQRPVQAGFRSGQENGRIQSSRGSTKPELYGCHSGWHGNERVRACNHIFSGRPQSEDCSLRGFS